jgi:hypothetical protein
MRDILVTLALAAATQAERPSASAPAQPQEGRPMYLFPYFMDNGQDGMRYAASEDGLSFNAVAGGRPFLKSSLGEGLVRDPSIVRGPDGTWHCVWTTGWWTKGFGCAHSDDLGTWTEPRWVGVMEGTKGAVNTWAPEIHWDAEHAEYLVLWSSTVKDLFPETAERGDAGPSGDTLNHRIYAPPRAISSPGATPACSTTPGSTASTRSCSPRTRRAAGP